MDTEMPACARLTAFAERHYPWAISTLFLLINIQQFLKYQVRYGDDSSRYISAASDWLNHVPITTKATSYLGYVAFVAIFQRLGSYHLLVITQILVSFVALICLVSMSRTITRSALYMLPGLLFTLSLDLQRWNVYLLPESLFISLLCIATYFIIARNQSWLDWLALSALSLLLCLIRPHGILFTIAIVVWLALRLLLAKRWRTVVVFAVIVGVSFYFFLLPKVDKMLSFETPLTHFLNGTIIWGYSKWKVTESSLNSYQSSDHSIGSIAAFFADHFLYCSKVAMQRIMALLLRAKPYYSSLHNATLLVFTIPLYLMIARGINCRFLADRRVQFLAIAMMIWVGAVALTFEDWDGRWFNHIYAFILLIAIS